MVNIAIGIYHCFVIDLLVAILAQAARVMRPVLVHALCCLPLVALAQVAEVAHEFCPMLTVIVDANAEEF